MRKTIIAIFTSILIISFISCEKDKSVYIDPDTVSWDTTFFAGKTTVNYAYDVLTVNYNMTDPSFDVKDIVVSEKTDGFNYVISYTDESLATSTISFDGVFDPDVYGNFRPSSDVSLVIISVTFNEAKDKKSFWLYLHNNL